MDMIGRYQKITELNNDNAGTCMWCYAVRGGQEYFIKKFPEPKYPTSDSEASPKLVAKKRARCEKFEQKKLKMYRAVNEASDGNVVRIADFFRVGAQYYMAMPRVKSVDMSPEEISKLPEHEKRKICTVIAHAVAQLHSAQFVHFDIKHENIMFTHSCAHKLTAKLIDYDGGFFEDNPPTCADEVGGSWPYFSPEAWILMDGGSAKLSSKLDVFALGILFHQYYTGKLPEYDENRFRSAGDAVRAGEKIDISVSPCVVSNDNPLSGVSDVFNAIMIHAQHLGDVMMYGKGAGKLPTASAVLSDIIEIIKAGKGSAQETWNIGDPGMLSDNYKVSDTYCVYIPHSFGASSEKVLSLFGKAQEVFSDNEGFGIIIENVSRSKIRKTLNPAGIKEYSVFRYIK